MLYTLRRSLHPNSSRRSQSGMALLEMAIVLVLVAVIAIPAVRTVGVKTSQNLAEEACGLGNEGFTGFTCMGTSQGEH